MKMSKFDRRQFGKAISAGTMSAFLSGYHARAFGEWKEPSRNRMERLAIGGIGLRYQGSVDLHIARSFGDVVAVCDVDKNVRDQAKASFGSHPKSFENYKDLIAMNNVDAVIIATPDHWHVKIAADALRAGKHVYVEKPITLTVAEGKFLREVVRETGKVLQVGSWQRSDSRFRLAVEMVRAGRIGKLQKVDVVLGKNKIGGPFKPTRPPKNFNWNLWQGQTPNVPYVEERSHYTFRWWLEYSGGQMTDWGCHHIDIAQWAINEYPTKIEAEGNWPAKQNHAYNVPVDFTVHYEYPNGIKMSVKDTGRNGIMFTGSEGRVFVNRGSLSGKPVEDLKNNPLVRRNFKLYPFDNLERPERAGKLVSIVNHMGNFVDCIQANEEPISDFESQHRSATTCHLGNISLQLGRKLKWDAKGEKFVGDKAADDLLQREQRKAFEVV